MIVPSNVFPPLEAYRYWPQGEYVYFGKPKNPVRFFFYKTTYTPYESEQLTQFKAALPALVPPYIFQSLPDPELLRLLLGSKFNRKKAAQAIIDAHEWRNRVMPNSYPSLWDKVQGVLQSGALYVHGRDHRFRPILVVSLERLDLNRHSADEFRDLLCFTLEYMVSHMLLPGQIENWIVFVNLDHIGLTSIPRTVRLYAGTKGDHQDSPR
jgi:hypothetical protein